MKDEALAYLFDLPSDWGLSWKHAELAARLKLPPLKRYPSGRVEPRGSTPFPDLPVEQIVRDIPMPQPTLRDELVLLVLLQFLR